MNSSQIRCFIESARQMSFTAAAAMLYLSPQAVSKQVISLEEDLGMRLFDRNGPRLSLTESGKLFFSLFTGLDRQLHFVLEDIRLYHKSQKMGLSVGISEWIDPAGAFLEGVNAFRAVYPNCKVSMSVYSNVDLLSALANGQADCAFFSEAQLPPGQDYHVRNVASEEVMLYAPADLGPGPAREDCWGLPLVMVSAWGWTHTELRIAGAREMTGIRLSPADKIVLPNLQSLYAKMEFSRCATLGGGRFNYLAKIPGLTAHPTGNHDGISCLWLRRHENTLAAQLAEQLCQYFAPAET